MRTWIRRIWITCGLTFTVWLVWNMQAHGVPAELLTSSGTVSVIDDGVSVRFMPTVASTNVAVVFLPGGGVDPTAYVPMLHTLAGRGHAATLVRLPWRAAFTESSRDETLRRVTDAAGQLQGAPWVLAGHSRGAALAADFAGRLMPHPSGLLLIATTHPRDVDRSALTMPVMKVLGTRDCVAPADDARANGRLLPATTEWAVIDGANHAQFGYYGTQLGDCAATISRAEQQQQLLSAIDTWLAALPSAIR